MKIYVNSKSWDSMSDKILISCTKNPLRFHFYEFYKGFFKVPFSTEIIINLFDFDRLMLGFS